MTVLRYVSASDIIEYIPLANKYNEDIGGITNWSENLCETNPVGFAKILHNLGITLNREIEQQVGFTFKDKNGLGKEVACTRWVGHERIDEEWINSGVATRQAKHLASGNKLLADMLGFNKQKEHLVAVSKPEDFPVPFEEDNNNKENK